MHKLIEEEPNNLLDIQIYYENRELLYGGYKSGKLTLSEYLVLITPLDKAIESYEMSTLRDMLVLKESF